MTTFRYAFIFLVFFIAGCSYHIHFDGDIDQKIYDIKVLLDKYHQEKQLNGNVLIARKQKILLAQSYGYVDSSQQVKLDGSYRFNIGSIYKEFPAVAIMQLVETKQLLLSDTLDMYLNDLPAWSEQINIKHLLQYSSGLPRVNWGKHQNIDDQDVFSDLQQLDELAFNPGTDYLYSNNNPFLLMKIIETVSQQSFYEYAIEHLFKPAQMNQTTLEESFPYQHRSLLAIPFNSQRKEDTFPIAISILYTTTVADLNQWLNALHSEKLISQESIDFLSLTVASDQSNKQSPLGSLKNINGYAEHQHHGSSGNFEAMMSYLEDEHINIIIATNQKHSNVHQITREIKNIIRN